ncbi:MAG: DUF1289 domain-containing protein [Pseudomonadota bacterium]
MTQPVLVSPCTGICRMDAETGWCLGCARTTQEIADWGGARPEWRRDIWSAIPDRMSRLGIACRRLPWSTEEIRSFVRTSLEQGTGTWVMGVVGAVAEFTPAPGMRAESRTMGATVTAETNNGAIALRIDDGVRALCFDAPDSPAKRERIVLAVKRETRRLPVAKTITRLGADISPLIRNDAGSLFDLGLGRKEARFCLRCAAGDAHNALLAATGTALEDCLPQIAPVLLRESPTRVVDTALGRIEVQGTIPPPGGRSPCGPHTHLLPGQLAPGRALPIGMDLPRAYLPGAAFYFW